LGSCRVYLGKDTWKTGIPHWPRAGQAVRERDFGNVMEIHNGPGRHHVVLCAQLLGQRRATGLRRAMKVFSEVSMGAPRTGAGRSRVGRGRVRAPRRAQAITPQGKGCLDQSSTPSWAGKRGSWAGFWGILSGGEEKTLVQPFKMLVVDFFTRGCTFSSFLFLVYLREDYLRSRRPPTNVGTTRMVPRKPGIT